MVNVLLTITPEGLASLYLWSGDAQLTPSPERGQTHGAETLSIHGKPVSPPPRALSSCCEPQLGYSPHCRSLRGDEGTRGGIHPSELLTVVRQPSVFSAKGLLPLLSVRHPQTFTTNQQTPLTQVRCRAAASHGTFSSKQHPATL